MRTIHNWQLNELVMELHNIARNIEAMDKMQALNAKELRALADRIHRVGQHYEYTEEEQFVSEYAVAMAGGPGYGSHWNNN